MTILDPSANVHYTYAQLEQLWINAGGSKATAPIAAAIAEAESGGDSQNVNLNDSNGQGGTQSSWGFWQISDGTHNQPVPNILDPRVNAKAAVAKYNADGWQPWGTYTSGAYTAFLSNSTPPDPTGVPAAGGGTATLTSDTKQGGGSTCVTGTILGFCVLSKKGARILVGGGLMVAAGLIMFPALILIGAAGFQKSGAQSAVSQAAGPLERTPGYGHAIRAARSRSRQP